MNNKNIPIINQKFDFFTFNKVLKKSLWIIIITFIFTFFGGFIYLRYTAPKYESSSIIQVSTKNKTNEFLGLSDIYDTEIVSVLELIRSKEFLKRCFNTLPLDVSYYNQGTFLSYELYKSSPFQVDYKITNSHLQNTPIYIDFEGTKIDISYEINKQSFNFSTTTDQWCKVHGGELKISIKSIEQIDEINNANYYFIINSEKSILQNYTNNISIDLLNSNAGTLKISFTDKNAKKTADVVNTIASEFIQYDIEKKSESAENIINYINKQLGLVFVQLDSTERELNDFKRSNKIKALSNGMYPQSSSSEMAMPLFSTRMSDFENIIINLDFEIQTLKTVSTELQSNSEPNIYELLAILSGTKSENFVNSMLGSISELYTKRAILLNEVTENNHKIKIIDQQIEAKKQQISNYIETTILRLEESRKNYQQKIDEYKSKIFNESSGEDINYSKLERLFGINESFYHQLIQKKAEYMISQAGYVSNNTILETAIIPQTHISPLKRNVFLVAIISALFISLIIIAIRYLFYNKITSIQDITNFTDIPVIGSVPLNDKKTEHSQLIVHKNPKSVLTESFRHIRSNMEFLTDSVSSKIIAISSTVPGEGKTFVAINLAGVLAMTDKKVILLDFDLRKPRLHKSFELNNDKGISTILIKKHTIEECLHDTEIENFKVLTSGPIPPNPSELVLTPNYMDFLNELKENYDFIIIDTPPVGVVTDAIRSFKQADYTLYVTRANQSPRTFLSYINNLAENQNLPKLNLILNGIEKSSAQYGYGYNYGYGYAYGVNNYVKNAGYYTEEDEPKKGIFSFLKFRKNK